MYQEAIINEKGRRKYCEDTYVFNKYKKGEEIYAGVYDGHGGAYASEYARDNLHKFFLDEISDEKKSIEKAFVHTYKKISDNLKDQESGTTAVDIYIKGNSVWHANVGDSHLLVIGKQGVTQLSEDHRLRNVYERARIVDNGGFIEGPFVTKEEFGLIPTRTLGDEYFKDVGVISTPATGKYIIKEGDKWILLGSDGLFDFLSNKEIGRVVMGNKDGKRAVQKLKSLVLEKKEGTDNLTIVLIKIIKEK